MITKIPREICILRVGQQVEGAVERLADFELTAALRADVDPTVRDVLVSLGGGDESYSYAPQPAPF